MKDVGPPLVQTGRPGEHGAPTLADFWDGQAHFVVDVPVTGLPLGESDTLVMADGTLWSYLHASHQSAGVVDQCGDPVAFPGCTVIYRSTDGGRTFTPPDPPVCQFQCTSCPCTSQGDHIDQQQYPRVEYAQHSAGDPFTLVYEYRGQNFVRHSQDGLAWSEPTKVPTTGIWQNWYRWCPSAARIGEHPHVPPFYDCLIGSPPGLFIDGDQRYFFVGMGQNPGSMGCYTGRLGAPVDWLVFCKNNPLFTGADTYGPPDLAGPGANPYFDFRTVSSAEVQRVGNRFYMLYEGVRGPGPGDDGDTQFNLGLARSTTDQIDGPWETFPGNPILLDVPGNVGVGHGDLIVLDGVTYLYTSLDDLTRSRLVLVWKP